MDALFQRRRPRRPLLCPHQRRGAALSRLPRRSAEAEADRLEGDHPRGAGRAGGRRRHRRCPGRSSTCTRRRPGCGCSTATARARERRDFVADAGHPHRRRRRMGRRRVVLRLPVVHRAADRLPHRPQGREPRRQRRGSRSKADIDFAAYEVEQVTYQSKDGTPVTMFLAHKKGLEARRQDADAAVRLRRLQRQPDAVVQCVAVPVPGAGRPAGDRQPARRRRVRRGLAPGRHARQEAERLRRLHRRRRVADRPKATPTATTWPSRAAATAACSSGRR